MRGCPLIRVCSLIRSNTVSQIWLNLILDNLVRVVRLMLDRCRTCAAAKVTKLVMGCSNDSAVAITHAWLTPQPSIQNVAAVCCVRLLCALILYVPLCSARTVPPRAVQPRGAGDPPRVGRGARPRGVPAGHPAAARPRAGADRTGTAK